MWRGVPALGDGRLPSWGDTLQDCTRRPGPSLLWPQPAPCPVPGKPAAGPARGPAGQSGLRELVPTQPCPGGAAFCPALSQKAPMWLLNPHCRSPAPHRASGQGSPPRPWPRLRSLQLEQHSSRQGLSSLARPQRPQGAPPAALRVSRARGGGAGRPAVRFRLDVISRCGPPQRRRHAGPPWLLSPARPDVALGVRDPDSCRTSSGRPLPL